MADITSLLPATTPSPGDIVYGVTDPSGTPGDAVFDISSLGNAIYPPFTTPVDGDFAWINQGGASVTVNGNGGIFLSAPADAGADLRIRKKAAPGATYVVTAAFIPTCPAINFLGFGLGWRESGSGKLAVLEMIHDSGFIFYSSKYNSATSYNAAYASLRFSVASVMWFQIEDDGANRIVRYSQDGYNFIDIHSVVNNDFITADEVLWCVKSDSANKASGLTLLSWEEA